MMPHGHHGGLFIRSSPIDVARCLSVWGNEPVVNRSTKVESAHLALEQAWKWVDDRTVHPNRALVVAVGDEWTGFFDNHLYEYVASAELYILCQRLRTESCFFGVNQRSGSPYYGSAQFCFNRSMRGEVIKRQVMAYKEDKWSFSEWGEVLPFEDVSAYKHRLIRERLTPEILRRYATALNLPYWDPEAYGRDVFLLRWNNHVGGSMEQAEKLLVDLYEQSLEAVGAGARQTPRG